MKKKNTKNPDVLLTIKLLFSWLFVGIPLLWGVIQVLAHSLELFK